MPRILCTLAVNDFTFEFDVTDRKIVARGIQMQIALRRQPGTDTAVPDRCFVWQRNGRFFGRLDDVADIFLKIGKVFRLVLIAQIAFFEQIRSIQTRLGSVFGASGSR